MTMNLPKSIFAISTLEILATPTSVAAVSDLTGYESNLPTISGGRMLTSHHARLPEDRAAHAVET